MDKKAENEKWLLTPEETELVTGGMAVDGKVLSAAEAGIKDADVAAEVTHFAQASVLQQAAQAMMAQSDRHAREELGLLR